MTSATTKVFEGFRASRRPCALGMLLCGWLLAQTAWAQTAGLANLPLYFEANRGQSDAPAQFIARSHDGVFRLSASEAFVTFASGASALSGASKSIEPGHWRNLQTASLQIQFLAANPGARISGAGELAARVNYLLGANPEAWRQDIPTFTRVQVDELYPGIQLSYYGNGRQLEYDFVVSPGADPGAIAFRVSGADQLQVDAQGDLLLKVGPTVLRQHKPVLYQSVGGQRRPIRGGYQLHGADTVAFAVGPYEPSLRLIIDPVLSYSSYLGGQGNDVGRAVALDGSGNIYVTGDTLSGQLAPTNAFEPAYLSGYPNAGGDAFVAKFDPTGTTLQYLTYLGGNGDEVGTAIAVDGAGNAYVTGVTDSTNFPTLLAISNNIAGRGRFGLAYHPYDAFVTKLDTGGNLVYSTYLGGNDRDEGLGIAVDPNTSIAYVTGYTQSTNFPTANPLQPKIGGRANAFVAAIASNGMSFVYSTYLGGTNIDHAADIAVDGLGRAYVTGFAFSTNFPTTNAFQSFQSNKGHASDAFVSALSTDGSTLVGSTFLGGIGSDMGYRLTLDGAGDVYVTGSQSGLGFPVTPGNLNPGGVFTSSDGATNWGALNNGLLHNQVYGLALDPNSSPLRLYAVTGRGIMLSTNGGAFWATSLNTLTQYVSIVMNPVIPSTLYAGGAGVLKSTDAGVSWFTNSSRFTTRPINKLVLDPNAPDTLYAATEGAGVFKTTDGAATWKRASSGLGSQVRDLALDPTDTSTLYAAAPGGVYRSTDAGAHWRLFNHGLTNRLAHALAVDPLTHTTVYVGTQHGNVFKSIDAGTNWFPLNSGLSSSNFVTALAIDPSNPATVYAGTTNGLFQSLDGGTNWVLATNGLTSADIATLLINPALPSSLYAGIFGTDAFGGVDAFVTKLSGDLSSVIYSVALGGNALDQGSDVAVDAAGNAFVVGSTYSTNFPTAQTVGFLTSTNHGGTNSLTSDVFVTAINPDASAFLYSSYLGGGSNDFGLSIAVDAAGDAVVLGQTLSPGFPTTPNARQSALYGTSDAFLAIIQPGSPLVAVSLQSAPDGLLLVVDGVTNASPFLTNWPAGSFHSVTTLPVQGGTNGEQFVWTSWSDAGALSHLVVADSDLALTANFKTQFLLTFTNSGPGAVSPASGWFDAGAQVPIQATPANGVAFAGWTGDGVGAFTGPDNPAVVAMDGPITELATFTGAANNVLTVVVNGGGTVSPSLNGKALPVGSVNTLSARPATGFVFAGWSGGVVATNATLTFTNQPGLVLQANFVPEALAATVGNYAGLFFDTNVEALAMSSSGLFTAKVSDHGAFSARLQLLQHNSSLSGRFSSSGYFSNSIARGRGLRRLSVVLQLDLSGSNTMSGQISDGEWTATLFANRSIFSSANPAPQGGKKYTLLLPGGADSLGQPGGDSFGTVNVDKSGTVRLAASLADGTRVSQSTFVSQAGQWPVFAPLYRRHVGGLLIGQVSFTNAPDTDLTGFVDWFRLGQVLTNTYPGGFLIQSEPIGSLYSFTNGMPVLDFGGGPGLLVLENGGLAQSLTNQVSLNAANQLSGPGTLNLSLNPSSGLLQGSLRDAAVTKKVIPLNAVVLQKQNRGAGYFSFTNQIGRVLLTP